MSRSRIVDDDVTLLRTLVLNLRTRQYDVDAVPTGQAALSVAVRTPPDLAIVDLGLPDMDGLEVIAQLRRRSAMPILVLSAHTEPSDKVAALDAGSDDHISKPLGMDELLARVRADLRRGVTGSGDGAVITTESFTADLAARTVIRVSRKSTHLTPTEWHLHGWLIRHQDAWSGGLTCSAPCWAAPTGRNRASGTARTPVDVHLGADAGTGGMAASPRPLAVRVAEVETVEAAHADAVGGELLAQLLAAACESLSSVKPREQAPVAHRALGDVEQASELRASCALKDSAAPSRAACHSAGRGPTSGADTGAPPRA